MLTGFVLYHVVFGNIIRVWVSLSQFLACFAP